MKLSDLLVELIEEKLGNADFVINDFMDNKEINSCDRCKDYFSTYSLVWLSADGFEPHENEIVPDIVYQKYDALCENCYSEVINYKE
jgi:hypothetical protein